MATQLSPISRLATRARYVGQQTARVGWYAGQAYRMRRMQAAAAEKDPSLKPDISAPTGNVPGIADLLRGVAALSVRDLTNIETGLYPAPKGATNWVKRVNEAREFFKEVPEIARRRADKRHQEARKAPRADKRPRYYQQNFHFQTDGWMSDRSAALYDTQVEVLFSGATEAMRRQALVPIAGFMKNRDQRSVHAIDLATGPGNMAEALTASYPRLPVVAIDLSEPYARHALKRFKRARHHGGLVAKAEELPLPDSSVDLITCVFLFHELPPKIRVDVALEVARVLKPGGMFAFVDSLQPGDNPDYDGLLELFPQLFHEPYYTSYAATNLSELFSASGLTKASDETAFVSKILTFQKPK